MTLASWLYSFNSTCPDPALNGYDDLPENERYAPRMVIWIGLLLAMEQFWHGFVLALSARGRLDFFDLRIAPRFRLPIGLALLVRRVTTGSANKKK